MSTFDNTNPNRIKAILAATFALNATCQLYQWAKESSNLFKANGCTVLFQHNASYYCLSNAHVLADMHLGTTFFLLNDGTTMTVGGEVFYSLPISSENRDDDFLDIAIVQLNHNVAERLLGNGQVFLKLNDMLTLPALSNGNVLLIAGYPASKTKIDLKKNKLKFNPLVARTVPYLRKFGIDNFTKGFHHIVEYPIGSFKETSTGQKMRAPKPHGISGSGLWVFPNDVAQGNNPALIGILSEYYENKAVMVSTKIDLYLDLIRQKFDSSITNNGISVDLAYEN